MLKTTPQNLRSKQPKEFKMLTILRDKRVNIRATLTCPDCATDISVQSGNPG